MKLRVFLRRFVLVSLYVIAIHLCLIHFLSINSLIVQASEEMPLLFEAFSGDLFNFFWFFFFLGGAENYRKDITCFQKSVT